MAAFTDSVGGRFFGDGHYLWLLAVDDAVFHYEGDFLEGGDVVERIAGDGDHVGEVTGFQRADSILPRE